MKQKANRKRGMIFLLSAVMVFSAFAVAHAEEGNGAASHVHTNKCHNENGDLICEFAQADNGKAGKAGKRAAAVEVDSNIYPGEKEGNIDGKDVWVAYDAKYDATKQPEDATVKATVTLPDGVTAPKDYKLFIDKIGEEDSFYPSEENVKKEASAINEYQCYMIRWVKLNDDNTVADTKSMADILGEGNSTAQNPKNVTIKIEYLKDEAKLEGKAGARKLLIFNSTEDGDLLDTVSDLVTDVKVTNTHYNSFTFNTHQAGPYVFVSKYLEKGYVQGLNVKEVIDGFKPFDENDNPGYDSNQNNGIVRSYDTIQYTLAATFKARQSGVTDERVNVFFELSLKKSATAARFDTTKMNWLEDNYSIEYLNGDGDVVMIQTHKGEFCLPQRDADGNVVRDEHGFAQASDTPVSFNAQLNGSKNGKESYKVSGSSVVEQRLTGWTTAVAKPNENILSATRDYKAAVEVRNADNEETFQPTFRMWLEGNEDNYGPEDNDGGSMTPAQPWKGNVVSPKPIKVSAGTNFNLQLKKNTDMSYKNWFDFSTGDVVAEEDQKKLDELAKLDANHGKSNPAEFVDEKGNELDADTKAKYENYRYGRITCYGITLQLYNDTDVEPVKDKRASKGLKGLSLPVGNIEFDLNFSSVVKSDNKEFDGSKKEYTPILWDYNENLPANQKYTFKYADPGRQSVTFEATGLGNGGRRLYWDSEERSPYAKGAAPSNYKDYFDGCYYGGDWALMKGDQKIDSREKLSEVAHPTKVMGTGEDTTYHFSVSDYDFDFDKHLFPLRDAGNSGNVTGYDTYARCFSAGCVQVLSVFPRVQKESTANIHLNATVSNLQLETRAGQKLQAKSGDSTKIEHEVNKEDNKRNDEIVVYAPGNLTKGSAFNGKYKDRAPNTTGEGFLGTEYWTTSYDCSTFAGDDIWIMSYGMMASGSDYHTKSMNLLQIFDSRALSIRGTPDVIQSYAEGNNPGNVKFLYAADPDYPNGYDTNSADGKQVVKYMNSVREEDLVYSEDIDMESGTITVDGKTLKCIGVLMEIRGCDLLGGKYQYMRIPIKVNGDDETLIGKTVATVNSFRIWSYDIGEKITWSKGNWNGKPGEDGKNVLEDYPTPGQEGNPEEGYSGELANKEGKLTYTKTEYEDGLKVEGTHNDGTLAGNSLLILGYKAHVNLTVDKKSSESGSHIYNQDSDETIVDYRLKNIKTEISDITHQTEAPKTTLEVRAVLDKENDTGKDRISIAGGSYKMNEQTISSDENAPTEVTFTAANGTSYTVYVYASLSGSGREVTFFIRNAPVGIQLPDITFQANFASIKNLTDNAAITANAYISGAGDNRAYSKADGNTDNVTVNVVLGGGTNLSKDVEEKYIELGGLIHYEITYTNSGSNDIDTVYFYDLLPNTPDIRDSKFDGDVILRAFDVKSSGTKDDAADATVYYSKVEYQKLYNEVKKFGGTMAPDGTVTGDERGVEAMLRNVDWFHELMTVSDGESENSPDLPTGDALTQEMEEITGLYIKVTKLKKNQTITLHFTIETKGNKAGDLYRNISNSWIPNNGTLPLKSTRVETAVISRSISGVVWYDHNLNGIRDIAAQSSGDQNSQQAYDKEKLLQGVIATLFKKDDTTGKYVKCTENVTGEEIEPVTTGADGAYSFDNLAQGDYIVAFSGDGLKPYTDATCYQQNGRNDSNTNDGVKTSEVSKVGSDVDGIDSDTYPYCIKYSTDTPNMTLHSIEDIKAGKVSLNNYREDISHQDLGVVAIGYKLPETGGSGTIPYTVGGLLLILASFVVWGVTDRRRQYR